MGEVTTRFETFGSSEDPLRLRSGEALGPATLAYETYGVLNAHRDNAILLFHALTGSQHAAGSNVAVDGVGELWNEECKEGWWEAFLGPGKVVDTDRFFVICANYLGGCYGSSGPLSEDPATGRAFGASFPRIAFADIVDANVRLLDHLGIERLHAVVGASTGGLACLSFATRYAGRVDRVVPIASGLVTTPLQRVQNFEQIQAIQNDPEFREGSYEPPGPERGLMLARMISHKMFVSLRDMEHRSSGAVSVSDTGSWYGVRHPLESYMMHQGRKLPERFDANAYLRILDAWQSFDLLADAGAESFHELFAACRHQRYLVFTIDSDMCFQPEEQLRLEITLENAGIDNLRVTVHSLKGHDSFLLEPQLYGPHLDFFLNS
ncbi:MAG: homoserine O-acetyltransferase [Acidobacteriota bacterium]|nr:homoserine O-acetyltransferase [Acidobacteriota bacterium]